MASSSAQESHRAHKRVHWFAREFTGS